MCLDIITKRFNGKEQKKVVKGWKVVLEKIDANGNKELFSPIQNNLNERFTTKWIEDKSEAYIGDSYKTGFHIFRTRKGARLWKKSYGKKPWKIVRVELTNIVCEGQQGGYIFSFIYGNKSIKVNVIVGRAIRIV